MSGKKNSGFYMRASRSDKASIAKLANRLRVSEADAVRLAVSNMLKPENLQRVISTIRHSFSMNNKVT